ncbi:MAG TPA: FHA domain-containing protein [Acidimicrobiales bacterium]|nr:FHA domain-containing protein [Acidimicrobiales bacterium]
MADQGSRYRSVTAAGLGAEAVGAIVASTLRASGDLVVHEIGPGRLSVSRTRRPTWASVACAATIWLAGLGLLFLLVRQTEAGEVTVVDGPRGCTVTLPALLDGATVHAVEAALRGPAHAAGEPVSTPAPTAPSAGVADRVDLDERTVARREVTMPASPTTRPTSPPMAPPRVALRFDGTTLVVEAGRRVLLGRDPSSTGGAVGHRVPGDATTVSKSHLLVDFDGSTVVVEDLGSTNGSTLTRDGASEPLVAGRRTTVAHGDRVALGAVSFVLDAHPSVAEVSTAWS